MEGKNKRKFLLTILFPTTPSKLLNTSFISSFIFYAKQGFKKGGRRTMNDQKTFHDFYMEEKNNFAYLLSDDYLKRHCHWNFFRDGVNLSQEG